MFVTIVVYRPGGEPASNQFFNELSAVLEQVASYSCPVVVTGDLNVQLDVVGGSIQLQVKIASHDDWTAVRCSAR